MACVHAATTSPSTEGSTSTTVTPVLSTNVQCILTDWMNWTPCTVTCGDGAQERYRNIIAGLCMEALKELRVCKMEPCPCIFTKDNYKSTFNKEPPADSKCIEEQAYFFYIDKHYFSRLCWLD